MSFLGTLSKSGPPRPTNARPVIELVNPFFAIFYIGYITVAGIFSQRFIFIPQYVYIWGSSRQLKPELIEVGCIRARLIWQSFLRKSSLILSFCTKSGTKRWPADRSCKELPSRVRAVRIFRGKRKRFVIFGGCVRVAKAYGLQSDVLSGVIFLVGAICFEFRRCL